MSKQKYITRTLTLPNGKRKYIRGKTVKEVEEKLRQAQREVGLGIDISDETLFRDYADSWFRLTKENNVSLGTERNMKAMLKNHIVPVLGDKKLRDIRASHIHQVMSNVSALSHGTQARVLQIMRSIFGLALDDGLIIRSPVPVLLKAGGNRTEETEPLTPEQEKELLEKAKGLRIYPAIYIIQHTGLRRGELAGLMWSDVDYDANVIHVNRHAVSDRHYRPELVDGAKTEAGVRDVPMPLPLVAYLKKLQSTASSIYVFPNSEGGVYSQAALSQLCEALQRRLDFPFHLHQLRHTYITHLFESGLDIKEIQTIAGHANEQITMRVYTHYRKASRFADTIAKVQAAF